MIQAAKGDVEWSRACVHHILLMAAESDRRAIDWDEDAGEAWGRVLEGAEVVALVSANVPLAITRGPHLNALTGDAGLVVAVEVEDLDAVNLSCDRTRLLEAFPEIGDVLDRDSPEFDPSAFRRTTSGT